MSINILVILTIVSINHWLLQQLNVSNAFLYGDITEDVYSVYSLGCSWLSSLSML